MLRQALSLIDDRLPPGWSLEIREKAVIGDRRVDAVVELSTADEYRGALVVDAKRRVTARDLPGILDRLQPSVDELGGSAVPMVVARYLGASIRASLEERGVCYADATGNLRVVLERPPLFLRDTGADRDPWRGPGRPRETLRGPPAARVVRALVDFAPPLTIPQVVRRSGASTGATYRVIEFLEAEGVVDREQRGPVTAVAWRRLLERWSADYAFQRDNSVGAYLQPRGLPTVLDALRESRELRYAVTGSLGAERLAAYAPPRLAMIYVDDLDRAAEQLGLRAVDSGANVLLAATDYDVVFERYTQVDGVTVAAPSQVAVDLLTGPGRSAREAEALLDWMEANERAWRQ